MIFLLTFWRLSDSGELIRLREPSAHKSILKALNLVYNQEYEQADSILENTRSLSPMASLYFRGLAKCIRFNDMGDTAALTRAEQLWEGLVRSAGKVDNANHQSSISAPEELYRGLALLQLGYISSVRRQQVEALAKFRKGIRRLKKFNNFLEVQCYLKIYEYYKNKLMSFFNWLPFVSRDNISSRRFLLQNYYHSNYLYGVLLVPLIWFHFDAGIYADGLSLSQQFLKKFPQNRIFRSIEADFLYKLGRYREAAEKFEALKLEYINAHAAYGRPCIEVNFRSVCGNLIRVYAALGDKGKQTKNAAIWFSPKSDSIRAWLPKSLVKDLQRFAPQ